MSPKNKSNARPAALPKDDLIDELLQAEGEGRSSLDDRLNTITKAPPDNLTDDTHGGQVFSFDDDSTKPLEPEGADSSGDSSGDSTRGNTRTLSIVSRPAGDSEDDDSSSPSEPEDPRTRAIRMESSAPYDFEVPEPRKPVATAKPKAPPPPPPAAPPVAPVTPEAAPKTEAKVEQKSEQKADAKASTSPRLQKLEDVLRRLKPQAKAQPGVHSKPEPEVEAKQEVKPKPFEGAVPPPQPQSKTQLIRADELKSTAEDEEKTTPLAAHAPQAQTSKAQSASPLSVVADVKTEVISPMTRSQAPEDDPEGERFMPTEIRPNSPGAKFREQAKQMQPGATIFSSAEAALRQSENLRVAQKRISDLEHELERVRRENESLRGASDTLRRRVDELSAHAEASDLNAQESKKIAEEEKKVLRGQISSRDREIADLKGRMEDAEGRLEANFRKIRVRERDLEHRIEIIKAESQSITASKDRMILELKRQIDQLTSELNHAKTQVQETFSQFKERQETARRAVRALRIALTVLEGEDE